MALPFCDVERVESFVSSYGTIYNAKRQGLRPGWATSTYKRDVHLLKDENVPAKFVEFSSTILTISIYMNLLRLLHRLRHGLLVLLIVLTVYQRKVNKKLRGEIRVLTMPEDPDGTEENND